MTHPIIAHIGSNEIIRRVTINYSHITQNRLLFSTFCFQVMIWFYLSLVSRMVDASNTNCLRATETSPVRIRYDHLAPALFVYPSKCDILLDQRWQWTTSKPTLGQLKVYKITQFVIFYFHEKYIVSLFKERHCVNNYGFKWMKLETNSSTTLGFIRDARNSRFLISDMHVQNKKYGNFVFISRLTGKCATQKKL